MPIQKTKKLPAKKISAVKSAKPLNGKNNGRPVSSPPPVSSPAPKPVKSDAKQQYQAFERGIQLLQKKNYREAKEMFEKARLGPVREIASNAQSHVRMCERRLASPPPEPKS